MAGDLFTPLHVDYQSDPKIIEAGHVAEVLFVRSLAMSKRLLSDGVVKRVQLPSLCLGLPGRAQTIVAALVGVGLWTEIDGGWQITNWLKWNPTAASLQAKAARKRASGLRANHERWHVGPNGKSSDTCSICYPDPSESDPNRTPTPTTVGLPKGREGKGREGIKEIALPSQRARNPMWDTLSELFSEPATKTEKTNRGRIIRELTEAGATPDDVRARHAEHARRRLHWTLTENALVTHWSDLAPKAEQGGTISDLLGYRYTGSM